MVDRSLPVAEHNEEHEVWAALIVPALAGIPDNVRAICRYGFNEMFNNVVSHSDSREVVVHLDRGPGEVSMEVIDSGVGIFRRIQDALGFQEARDVVLELSKGKLTTDPTRHTGEGIFFTSRMFDHFAILSGNLFWACTPDQRDWLIENREGPPGTLVGMRISAASRRTEQQVFDRYSDPVGYRFNRTEVPILLAAFGEDPLVSRSGARRVLSRLERFDHVVLDFAGVKRIGQQFADEIFRVFALEHPNVTIRTFRANRAVSGMISRAKAALNEQRQAAESR